MDVKVLALGDYQTNCYILSKEGDSACLVIDPGYESSRLNAALEGHTVEAILLTHGHFDHVGGVRALAMEDGCPVYMGRDEVSLPPMMSAGTLYYTNLMDDGDELDLAGLHIRVMKTPGHSPGSVCFMVEDCLFSGDTLFAGSCGRTDFPGSDPKAMLASLGRLRDLDKDYRVYPGHGSATTLNLEKSYNPYLD